MAEKGFGVKEINLIGASGTPTIESPNNLNLNAVNVAISTNVSIGGTLTVSGNVSVGGTLTYEDVTNIDSVGLITARNGLIVNTGAGATFSRITLDASGNNDTVTTTGSSGLKISNSASIVLQEAGGSPNTYASFADNGLSFYRTGSLKLNHTGSGFDFYDNLIVNADSTYDIGTNSTRWRNVYADTYYGSGANLTNLPAATPTTSDIQVAYELLSTSSSSNGYRISGNGVNSSTNNPDLFLTRGVKYRFINNSGGTHPFRIQSDSSSTLYSTGVTNNNASSGNIDFAPTFDSPSHLYYKCGNHPSMLGNIYLTGGVGRWIQQSIVTLQSGSSYEFTGIPADVNEVMIVFDGLSFDSGSNEIEFVLGNSGGYATSGYVISASYEPGGNYQKRTSSIRFNGIGSASYVPTGRLHLWKPVHSANWWVEGICYPWETEGQYQHRVTGTANSGGTLSKIKIQGSAGANFDNTGNGKIQLSYIRY